MRASRLFIITLVACSALTVANAAPSTAHAAGLRQYRASCYSLSYPAGWTVKRNGATTTFSTQKGKVFTVIGGVCVSHPGTIKQLTAAEIKEYQSKGFRVKGGPHYNGTSSTITFQGIYRGQSVIWDLISNVHRGGGFYFYLLTNTKNLWTAWPTWLRVVHSIRAV